MTEDTLTIEGDAFCELLRLRDEVAQLQQLNLSLAERVAGQSELLSRKAAKAAPRRPLHRLLGHTLAVANAGVDYLCTCRTEFYDLKKRILSKYGELIGIDWQAIEKRCWGCAMCLGDDEDFYYSRRHGGCNGDGWYSRKYIPLQRYRLDCYVFHTPGEAVPVKPEGVEIKINGTVKHRHVEPLDARFAFAQLCARFDREMFRRVVVRLFGLQAEAVGF